ncbi:MAG: xanthine dehydrogenase family protein molybdopterin-binding subunit [Limnohabitans sp.]
MDTTHLRFGSGQSVRRLEDEQLLRGHGQYADDVVLNAQSRLAFLRSPYPHANIRSIDTTAAQAMPGVHLVLTGAQWRAAGLKDMPPLANFVRPDGKPAATAARCPLAFERVRFVGEPVVAIVADTEQQAKDAAEAVVVDYEELPCAVTLQDALAPNAPLLSDAPDNRSAETRYGDAASVDKAFASAKHVVKLDIDNQRVAALSIEPRSVLAYVDQGRLTIRMSSQMPTGVRTVVSTLLGLPAEQVRVVIGDVGGGFGMKTGAYAEDVVTAYCAHRLQRPVKWIADRGEDFLSSAHGRDIQCHAEMALNDQGKVLGLRIRTHANVGAYPGMTGIAIQVLIGPWVQTSVYDIQNIDFHYTAVLTNTAPTGAYRGAGRPEAIFNIERLMDEAARQSGIDRITLRRRNFIQPAQMPYKNPMGQTYDTGAFESVMDQGLKQADWSGFDQRAAESARRGLWRGLGIATFLEWTGGNALEENVNVRIMDDGVIEVFTAVNGMGQGIATTLAQLVVDIFNVPLSQVRIVMGDTDRGNGFGSAGSRSLFTGGSAVSVGSTQALERARELAAQALEAAPEDVQYDAGRFTVAGTDLHMTLAEVAQRQPERRIELDSKTAASGPTWPNGCHICEVEVDPATGTVQLASYSSVNDVGRVVNPMIVRGQLDGGAVQGLGQALCESLVYDRETGQPVTGSLMDYAVPHADIMPRFFVTSMDESTPCKNNVLGVKGVGELGTIGATPAVVNAVADALARHGKGALSAKIQMPMTPARIWELLQQA